MDASLLQERLTLACHWLTEVAQVRNEELYPTETRRHVHETWSGAFRGEYRAATRAWGSYCPVWHTGQAVRALVMAAPFAGGGTLDAACAGGDFILRQAVKDGPDRGLLLAYEDEDAQVNTSAILEALAGLFALAEATGTERYRNTALEALDWVARRAYIPGEGWFRDCYDCRTGTFSTKRFGTAGRPLLDDAVFAEGYRLTGEERFKTIALETAERLLREEDPPGNWIGYAPCSRTRGVIHPRHAFWWGYPMLEIHRLSGDPRFLQAFFRSVDWYRQALRRDGGLFRGTYTDFSTDSFGHATSGVGCAVRMFLDAADLPGAPDVSALIPLGLEYCMNQQFTCPADPWLKGAILEKVLSVKVAGGGSDASPYHIRDLGTIFFVQAAAQYLARLPQNRPPSGAPAG